MIKPMNLKPFGKFCFNEGIVPSSYDDALTYYEMLNWLCDYLAKTVIPAVNNNAEAVEELQNLYTTLKNFVDNYFENLNVQEEINNKLDEMASDGTLATIIEDYATIPELTTRLTNLENDFINSRLTEMVVIGDSYSSRSYLATPNKLWCEIVASDLGLNLHNYADPGAGFLNHGDERQSTFITQIAEAASDTTFRNNKVKYLFIMGGVNDLRYYSSNAISTFTQAYNQLCINARNSFPTAKIVYLGCPTFLNFEQKSMSDGQTVTQLWVDNYIKNCDQAKNKQIAFLDMTLFYLGMSNYFGDGVGNHPNAIAHRDLAQAIINGLTNSGNAFRHLITATPVIDTQSASHFTVGTTTVGENNYQLRITDKEINIYLSTAVTRDDVNQNLCVMDLPFNMIIPYSTQFANLFVPQNNTCSYFEFASQHDNANCQGDGVLPVIHNFGYKYFTLYIRWVKNTTLTLDINYKVTLEL